MRSHRTLAALAKRQYGVVSRRQLLSLGFSKSAIGRLSSADRLHRVHRGVYAVGHADVSDHGRCLAAVLACGSGAVLSHDSAAWLWGLHTWCAGTASVTVPRAGKRRRGIHLHHAPALAGMEVVVQERIPVTSLPRTLLDLAVSASPRSLGRAVDRAKRIGRLDLVAIDACLGDLPGAPGSRALRGALELYRQPVFERAKSELLFLDLVAKAGLPAPAINTWVERWEIDAYWATERFAVEVDGWESHGSRAAFEGDRLRIEDLKLAGIDAVRVTARRIETHPADVASRLRRHLERRRRDLRLAPLP